MMTDGRTTCSVSRETASKQNPVGRASSGGVLCSETGRRKLRACHEERISFPSKRIAVCSDPDSGTPKNGPGLLAGPRWVGHAAQVADWAARPPCDVHKARLWNWFH